MRIELHTEAEAELEEACDFYDGERPGLGQELLVEVRRGFELGLGAGHPSSLGEHPVAQGPHRQRDEKLVHEIGHFFLHETALSPLPRGVFRQGRPLVEGQPVGA